MCCSCLSVWPHTTHHPPASTLLCCFSAPCCLPEVRGIFQLLARPQYLHVSGPGIELGYNREFRFALYNDLLKRVEGQFDSGVQNFFQILQVVPRPQPGFYFSCSAGALLHIPKIRGSGSIQLQDQTPAEISVRVFSSPIGFPLACAASVGLQSCIALFETWP